MGLLTVLLAAGSNEPTPGAEMGRHFAALKASASRLVEAGYLLAEDVDTVAQSCLAPGWRGHCRPWSSLCEPQRDCHVPRQARDDPSTGSV